MKLIKVTVKGIDPGLLMNRFPQGTDEVKKTTGVPAWEDEAEKHLYQDPEGKLYQPAEHFEASMRIAASNFKVPGKRGSTFAKLIGATIDVVPFAIPHKIQKWETDARPVVVQRARVIRYRPLLKEWELDFEILLHDDQLKVDVVKQILDHAGLYVGIGDKRPGKSGKYGKFMVTVFKEKP